MFDTVILEIIIDLRAIIDRNKFKPQISESILEQNGFKSFKNNPTQEDKKQWGYLPRLTLFQRGRYLFNLKIEFSVPKLLFGNNRDEFAESDFENVVSRIKEAVKNLGVLLTDEQIKKASVSGFHPSKNIILSEGYSATFAIRELSKADISQKFDIDCKPYRNGGEVLQFYSIQHALCFYDKKRDETKPAKRAFDKDQIPNQKSLFQDSDKETEILRIEIRLTDRRKMKEIFEKIGYADLEMNFENLFNKDLCQKILKYYWNYFLGDSQFLFDARNSPQAILNMVLAKNKNKKMPLYKLFGLVGFILCSKDEEGTVGLRKIIEFYKPKNNWTKTKRWLDEFKKDLDKTYLHGFIKDIETQLNEFKPLKLSACGVKNCQV